jgi:hypothetical protein
MAVTQIQMNDLKMLDSDDIFHDCSHIKDGCQTPLSDLFAITRF